MEIAVLLGGAFVVAFAVGATGFADALLASAIWLHVFPPQETVPLIFLTGIVVHALSAVHLRRALEPRRLAPFALGGLVATPLGVAALQAIDPGPLKQAVGIALVVVACWQMTAVLRSNARSRLVLAGEGPAQKLADGAVGGIGGFLGGVAGMSGVVPTLWCGFRNWSADVQRGVYQPFILVMHLWAFSALWISGGLPAGLFERFLWCLPALLVGLVLGLAVYARIDQRKFRLTLLGVLGLSGLALLL